LNDSSNNSSNDTFINIVPNTTPNTTTESNKSPGELNQDDKQYAIFREIDTNDNGYLSENEIKHYYNMAQSAALGVIMKYQSTNNGLNYEDFLKWLNG